MTDESLAQELCSLFNQMYEHTYELKYVHNGLRGKCCGWPKWDKIKIRSGRKVVLKARWTLTTNETEILKFSKEYKELLINYLYALKVTGLPRMKREAKQFDDQCKWEDEHMGPASPI